MRADLHIHTSKSDGTDSVEEIIDKAINIGLDAVAITDHDNVSALEDGERYAKGKLTFIRGIEFSAYSNQEVHILGYGFDYKADIITETVDTLIKKSRENNRKTQRQKYTRRFRRTQKRMYRQTAHSSSNQGKRLREVDKRGVRSVFGV